MQMIQMVPVKEQLSTQARREQEERRQAFLKELHCLRFLLRQKEEEGNLWQMLLMWSIYDSSLRRWVKEKKYLSHVIVNVLITSMGLSVLRSLLTNIVFLLGML